MLFSVLFLWTVTEKLYSSCPVLASAPNLDPSRLPPGRSLTDMPRPSMRRPSISTSVSPVSPYYLPQHVTLASSQYSMPPSPSTNTSPSASPVSVSASLKDDDKKHQCRSCGRNFSTGGHLARHAKIHTGERNHKCPFPGCETRCSRQDNLQQQ